MPRIVDNRICYPNHNIVLDPSVHKDRPDYIMDIEAALTPEGDARLHKAQLDSFTSIACWVVERPTLTILPEINRPLTHMVATATLSNGNCQKTIFTTTCARSESFYPIYGLMSRQGLDVGNSARREAETEYFKQYDAIVALATATTGAFA